MFNDEPIELSDEIFKLLKDLIYKSSGVWFDENSKDILRMRLTNSVQRHQFKSFKDYYYFLRYDREKDAELASLLDIVTNHETYFFREMPQLKAFSEEILPEIIDIKKKEGSKDIKIWSAGCSTGEEAYTIAMLFLESKMFNNVNIEVFATDISHRVLHSARKGFYQKHSFRTTDSEMIAKYFIQEENGCKISDKVKEKVNFGYFNLLDSDKSAFINRMDVIFCRNVIIYFDMPAKKKVIEMFYEKLSNLGFLLLGHSESLINISTAFTLRHFKNDMVYQKIVK
ncbi:MAG: chemotaxis protein CheR [Nitrospirae bacterium RBG_19FT_COMBO_42_15]|nr:MAG: chemotaxis protein CheR [Nitrospirae bacterium RBG_19FT_COMBO_42_15]